MRVALEIRTETHLLEIVSQLAENVPFLNIGKKEIEGYRKDMQLALAVQSVPEDQEREEIRVAKAALAVFRKYIDGIAHRLPKGMAILCTPCPSVIIVTDEKEHMGDGEVIAKGTCSLTAK